MSSHNKGHRNHPISFLSKEAITGWILYATRNQPTQGLVYGTSSLGDHELLLTALPIPVETGRNRSFSHS